MCVCQCVREEMAKSISVNAKLPPGAFQLIATHWYHSMYEQVKVDFEWNIHQFELRDREQSIEFSAITNVGTTDTIWRLRLDDEGLSIAHCIAHCVTDDSRFTHRFQGKSVRGVSV